MPTAPGFWAGETLVSAGIRRAKENEGEQAATSPRSQHQRGKEFNMGRVTLGFSRLIFPSNYT